MPDIFIKANHSQDKEPFRTLNCMQT